MAKRAKDTEAYRPVRASLVADVLAGGTATAPELVQEAPRPAPHPLPVHRPQARLVEPRARVPQPEPELEVLRQDQAFDPRQKLSREKRYLLSADEEDRIEDLVRSMARELQTPLKLSHLVRAAISLITRSQTELLNQARAADPLLRPSNGDTPALLRFESDVAKLLDAAFRMTKPL